MADDDLYAHVTFEEWLDRTVRSSNSAREDVERFIGTTAQERFDALRVVQATAAGFVGDRPLERLGDDRDFWRRWMDPSVGRPR